MDETLVQVKRDLDAGDARPLQWSYLPGLLFGFTCTLAALDFVFLALSWRTRVPDTWGLRGDFAILAIAFASVGLILARRRPQNPIGWIFLLAGLVAATVQLSIEYSTFALLTRPGALPGGVIAGWVASWLWFVFIGALFYVFLIFPTGRLPSERWRAVGWIVIAAFGLMTFTFMFRPGPLYYAPYLDNPFAILSSDRTVNFLRQASTVGTALGSLLVGLSILMRLRRAKGVERQQLKWFAYAAGMMSVIGVINVVGSSAGLPGTGPKSFQFFTFAVWIAIPFTVGLAILRYRLYDIDRVINRTLVYGTLSVGIVALYILLVGALGALSETSGNLLVSLLATGLIAFLFQPLRERLQRGVNRLMYGERDEPYALMARLGQNLERTVAPEAALVTLASTIAQALKLPYVAIEAGRDGEAEIAAAYGQPSSQAQSIPLTYQGEQVGQLLVAPRAPKEPLSPADLNLLRIIAQQAGMAVHAVQLTEALQRSRERLVVAREEERRRIRRDLHDGLGPALASLAMEADSARDWTHADPAKTDATLADITTKAQAALQDIRRLVYDLRPPALDELGLVGALRQTAANSANGLQVEIDAREPLPALSAAVEVAAYRIAQETLTNVVRHSHAQHCRIHISAQEELRLEIGDDGVGFPRDMHAGVGLISMRERALELGGSCIIESERGAGTRVLARLPLAGHASEYG